MKMTDVITGLRELNPELQSAFAEMEKVVLATKDLADDCSNAKTVAGAAAIMPVLANAATNLAFLYEKTKAVVAKVDALEKSYTRELAKDKPDEAKPDATPMLPGMEEAIADAEKEATHE